MKQRFFLSLIVFLTSGYYSQSQSGEEYLKVLHEKFYLAPCKIYSFSQKNTHYRNDSAIRTSVWHEAIEFPDKFRIHFGEPSKGNYVLFRNDSVYNYKQDKLFKTRADSNTLLLILGGMFYRKFEDVLLRIKNAGYLTTVLSKQQWNKKETIVIGANEGDIISNQIWFDANTLKVLRIIEKLNATETMDIRFESYQNWCQGHVETKVAFYRNGKLEQVEEYYDLKILDKFPE